MESEKKKMKIDRQMVKLPITEIPASNTSTEMNIRKRHGVLLPSSIRGIICGPSNCGKTNVLLNLIYDPNGLVFENIYLYSKSLYQPKYQELEQVLSKCPEIGYYPFGDNDSVISPDEAEENSIFIFDDVACEQQNHIRSYFCMGRHKNVDSLYLTQTYSRIPKHLVRDNANFLVLFRQDDMNLRHIYTDHVNTDMTFNDFRNYCAQCWNSMKYGCLVIDKTSDVNKGRYRLGFHDYIITH